ncbi:MAG: hypothetical protein JXR36_06295, partial [Bacteroidales bacterium]|nr:hypothetical protein [Bacteroidales bacterium]
VRLVSLSNHRSEPCRSGINNSKKHVWFLLIARQCLCPMDKVKKRRALFLLMLKSYGLKKITKNKGLPVGH